VLLTLALSDRQARELLSFWIRSDRNIVDITPDFDPEICGFTPDPRGNGGRWTSLAGDEGVLYHDGVEWIFEFSGERKSLYSEACPIKILNSDDLVEVTEYVTEDLGKPWWSV
jgi:hypothetical protein